ncbi:hypothetical protein DITRI_Ditri02bG0178400 [Diplodiscus trichospermus]
MDEHGVHQSAPVANGDKGLFLCRNENSGFDSRSTANSQSVSEVLKCFLIKFLLDGTDVLLKDATSRKINLVANGFGNRTDSSQTGPINGECSFKNKQVKVNCKDARNHEYVNISNVVNSSLGSYTEILLNFLAFLATLMMKLLGFQFNLLVGFLTFPIWFSYFAFMSLIFPLQAVRQIKCYLMTKLFKTWDDASKSVKQKAKNSMGNLELRFGCAFFWSCYVSFMLVGLLVSGFLFGGFMMRCLLEKPIQTTETLNFDYSKPSPIAFVPIMLSPVTADSSNLIPNDDMNSGKEIGPRAIPYNQRLQLTVSLTVPESEYNRKLGVFQQVRVEFLSADGKVTASSKYPCMLRFKSQTIRFAETIFKSIPLITGYQSESQVLNIKMNDFTEGLEPTACLKVILEQRAEFQPGAGIPEIYTASLALESELPQLKRMIWCWRRTIFVCTSIMWFLTEVLVILLFCRPMIIPRGRPRIGYGKKFSQPNFISYKTESS